MSSEIAATTVSSAIELGFVGLEADGGVKTHAVRTHKMTDDLSVYRQNNLTVCRQNSQSSWECSERSVSRSQ